MRKTIVTYVPNLGSIHKWNRGN